MYCLAIVSPKLDPESAAARSAIVGPRTGSRTGLRTGLRTGPRTGPRTGLFLAPGASLGVLGHFFSDPNPLRYKIRNVLQGLSRPIFLDEIEGLATKIGFLINPAGCKAL